MRGLSGGWSSHFEFLDPASRRIRCDFVTQPPRRDADALARVHGEAVARGRLRVIPLEELVAIKQTQRAKDYAVISELARQLPVERELALTWDPDRIREIAPRVTTSCDRDAVRIAHDGGSREEVAVALARESNRLQEADRDRLDVYANAATSYMKAVRDLDLASVALLGAHEIIVDLALRLLPSRLGAF